MTAPPRAAPRLGRCCATDANPRRQKDGEKARGASRFRCPRVVRRGRRLQTNRCGRRRRWVSCTLRGRASESLREEERVLQADDALQGCAVLDLDCARLYFPIPSRATYRTAQRRRIVWPGGCETDPKVGLAGPCGVKGALPSNSRPAARCQRLQHAVWPYSAAMRVLWLPAGVSQALCQGCRTRTAGSIYPLPLHRHSVPIGWPSPRCPSLVSLPGVSFVHDAALLNLLS